MTAAVQRVIGSLLYGNPQLFNEIGVAMWVVKAVAVRRGGEEVKVLARVIQPPDSEEPHLPTEVFVISKRDRIPRRGDVVILHHVQNHAEEVPEEELGSLVACLVCRCGGYMQPSLFSKQGWLY
jgi:hypothetical protein